MTWRIEQFKLENGIQSDGDDVDEVLAMKSPTDRNGFSYCLRHGREVCRDCFQNHSVIIKTIQATAAMQLGDKGPKSPRPAPRCSGIPGIVCFGIRQGAA